MDASDRSRLESPIGTIEVRVNEGGAVVSVSFVDEAPTETAEPDTACVRALRQLEEYFRGERRRFELALEPEGTEFEHKVWNQVRRMVAALVGLVKGEVEPERVGAALAGGLKQDLGIAPPEPLILMGVEYEPAVVFEPVPNNARHAREWLEHALERIAIRQYLLRATLERVVKP